MQNNFLAADLAFLNEMNRRKPTRQPEKSICKWIDGRRVMPAGSPFEGIYSLALTPYLMEIIDNFGPFSKVKHTALKKGVQVGATTAAEDIIAYGIGERASKMMYMSATDTLTELFSTDRLDPLIDSCGLRQLISDQSESFHSRKTGDKSKYKQFPGGSLVLTSAQSAAKMRSMSIKTLIRDEIDGAPSQLTTGEGNFLAVSEGRLEAFGDRAKIFDLSTPTVFGDSLIDEQFDKGDQRVFMVQCPRCLKYQFLEMGDDKSKHGLKGDYQAGELIQGYYSCYHCTEPAFDSDKQFMLASGHWEPMAKPSYKNFRSYHLPSFYSPPGMTSFTKIRSKYDDAQKVGDDAYRAFRNLYEGLSFEPTGERPDLKTVIEIRNRYKSGEVPSGILYLTMAVDVQRGKDKFKNYTQDDINEYVEKHTKKKDWKKLAGLPRLEAEVMGHGRDHRTASIIYNKFYGKIDDYTSGAWGKLESYMSEGLIFKRKDGFEFPVQVVFVDSGWGEHTHLVYNFCASLPMTYAIKGQGTQKQDKLKLNNITERKQNDFMRFKLSSSSGSSFVLIHTNYYKTNIYLNFKNTTTAINSQPPSSHIAPADYPDSYFEGLRAEKKKVDGSFHNPTGKPNEPLDLLVYNKCASDFIIQNFIDRDQEEYKRRYPRLKDKSIESREFLKKEVNRDTVTDRFEKTLREDGW